MNDRQKLLTIKIIHTMIWLFFVAIIFYIVYCGIIGDVDLYTWLAIGLVLAEGIVLVIFKQHCPLTLEARKYSASTKDNFDIFLPNWLAKYNKEIFTSLFVLGTSLVFFRILC